MSRHKISGITLVIAGSVLAVCGGSPASANGLSVGVANAKPSFIRGAVRSQTYDGISDDLLTAGLGAAGLAGTAPAIVNPASPTAAELRRLAIWSNYRALVDVAANGGYGRLYGPNVTADGTVTGSAGKIAGKEFIAYADDGSGRQNVVLMVQLPDTFNPAKPCIVTATSSGSRGIYGAIGTSGEWGLKHGCAVAYTDKGSGNGFHDLQSNRVTLIDGTIADADAAGTDAHFRAPVSDTARTAYNAQYPNRVAYKHAHSQQNPEMDWGKNTLQAIEFAFYVLNEQYGTRNGAVKARAIVPANTLVIASSVSNGGGAAVAAAEQDKHGLIDAVVVSEPNVQPKDNDKLVIKRGNRVVTTHSKPLADYFTYASLFQPCAALAVPNSPGAALLSAANSANRCTALAAKGLVSGSTTAERAADALDKLHAYGWEAEQDALQASHYRLATPAIAMTYTNTYGRFSVTDNLCGFSFANTDASGNVVAQNPLVQAALFSTGNGVPPTSGVNIVYNDAVGGPRLDLLSVSPSTQLADFAFDGALCQRALVTGIDPVSGTALKGEMRARSQRMRQGISEVQLSGELRNKPVIIVAGRSDTLLPLNHTSRAYFGKLQMAGAGANVRFIEVENGNHFDAFIDTPLLPGYDSRLIPIHYYMIQALDRMWAHLTTGAALPGSQVVRTVPRGGTPGAAPAITTANVPPIATTPAAANAITFANNTLTIPD
ncbi:3-hydroxybutyrate oligomer hydrolase family protein [Noviherbaspirillum autotrophicum]|uniref:D-(-)-3-hydroxybutyrate oligomer hydrolase n=1 Tax=Noviherbaspirillum autotrophicum TaxID=709839 RepID=A0A0C1YP15_9BURK|nr:3-hydroxybutyrate oligomer hydrolase family protein [Noviherbaspirillum autotrophicum]KIF82342.1 cytochrome C1 [Noviherbaspirillum autotrophicum]